MNPQFVIDGNITADPDIKFGASGVPMATFSVAHTERKKQGEEWVDGDTMFIRVLCFQKLAENVGESLTKGTRVVVHGRARANNWVNKDGVERKDIEIVADSVSISLATQTAVVSRNAKQQAGFVPTGNSAPVRMAEPW